ncbi:EAL domain-containing protein [Mycolicibacterium sp. Dal123E01]|uniref:EAL domain-containing protein n=1 Tax=Mycolicibacterium sp. Dal123E01 TaxID=3457578 RepID=UPI00403ED7B9
MPRFVDRIALSSVCEPIVSLADGGLAGYEAWTCWPLLDNPTPGDVFIRALAAGQLRSFNEQCVDSAIGAAIDAGLPQHSLLLINNQAGGRFRGLSEDAAQARLQYGFRLAYELTGRDVLRRPRELVDMVAALRQNGMVIALSGVGANPDSSVLLDVLEPEVVKVDPSLADPRLSGEQTRALDAVIEYRERTGSVVLARGIKTEAQRERWLELGATLGLRLGFNHDQLSSINGPN